MITSIAIYFQDQQGEPMKNIWYPELEEEITPYNLLTTRNSVSGNKAYFVVLARTEADVISSIKFAKSHSMALSVFSTGHEFNDRNGGLATNSILIRTTCLRTADINLEPSTVFNHTEGVIRLGSGMTWSWSKFGDVGVHQLANQVGRVVVSGHAGNVGIVGWSLGGGHGQLVGTYGMGVDQVLEVEMIIANGTKVIANAMSTTQVLQDGTQLQSEDSSLFWALRGGGAGPWGVITAMKIKLHKPRNDCKENCFTQWHASWVGSYAEDGPELLQELIHNYLKWSGTSSKYWSSYASPYSVDDDHFGFAIFEALFVGTEKDNDFLSFFETFSSVRTDKMVDIGSKTYDTFLKKIEDQTLETVMPKWEVEPMTSVLMNSSAVANMAAAEMLAYNWIPRCYLQWTPCIGGILFMHTVSTGEEDDYYTGTAVSPMFRQAKMHVSALSYISLTHEMSFEEKVKFAHEEIGPEFYK